MSDHRSLLERFQEMPRAIQWALYAAAFGILFLSWDEVLGPVVAGWNAKADRIEADLIEVREAENLGSRLKAKRQAIIALGEVALPQGEQAGGEALTDAVVDVLRDYSSVKDDEFNLGSGRKLPKTIESQLTQISPRPGARLIQLTGDVNFEASPQDAIDIIRTFESRPEIAAVSLVRIQKGDRGRLRVSMTLESWAFES